MHQRFERKQNRGIIFLFILSLLVHLLILLAALPFLSKDKEHARPNKKTLEVRVVRETDLKKILLSMRKTPKKKKAEKKPLPRQKPRPLPSTADRKAVEQDTNRVQPKTASYVSAHDNTVAEQTRARKTQEADQASNKEQKAAPQKPNRDRQQEETEASIRGSLTQENKEKAKPVEGLVLKKKGTKKFGNPFQKPLLGEARRVLAQPGFNRRRMEARSGRKLMKNYDKNDKALKASLENFIPEIKPGNHTGVNSFKHVGAGYLAHIHRKIHPLWAENYLLKLDLYEAIDSELNNPTLATKLEFVIDGKTGEVEKITVVKSSGALRFDAEAISIGHQVGPHRPAPKNIVSPNGKVYIHWNFWRNQRQCGTFGASIFLMEKDA